MQKPLTFRPPCCDLTYRPHWPGRWATLSTFLQNHTPLIHCHCVAWRLMQLSSDVEALWRVSSVWPIHGSGFKQHCLGANNTFPQESAAQLTSGPLQFHAQNEVSGDTEKRREVTLQPFPCSFADISTMQVCGLHLQPSQKVWAADDNAPRHPEVSGEELFQRESPFLPGSFLAPARR